MSEQDGPVSPMNWLWQELERRFGVEAAREIHQEYNACQRRYEAALQVRRKRRRAEADQFFRRKAEEGEPDATSETQSV